GGAAKGGVPPLSTAELESALLTKGDVPGWTTGSADADAIVPKERFGTDREACAPVADVLSSEPKYARTAYTSGSLVKGGAAGGGTVHSVLLAAHERGEAAKWLTELRGAVRSCDAFTGTGGAGGPRYEVAPEDPGAPAGDDSVAFRLTGAGDASDLVVTVVRTGANTASYLSFGVADTPEPIERKVAVRQHEKLVEAAAG
ncbi:sensor domain-containing protein, partial [Streptomyces sp. Ru87]